MLIHLQLVEVTFRYTQNAFACLKICRCHCHYRLLNFDLCTTMRKSSHLTTILRAIFSSYTIKSSSFHSFASIYDCIYEHKPFPMCIQSFAVKWYILIIAKQHQWTMAWPQVWVIGVTFDGKPPLSNAIEPMKLNDVLEFNWCACSKVYKCTLFLRNAIVNLWFSFDKLNHSFNENISMYDQMMYTHTFRRIRLDDRKNVIGSHLFPSIRFVLSYIYKSMYIVHCTMESILIY